MILHINCNDDDHYSYLPRDANFQFLAFHSIGFNQNTRPSSSKKHDTFSHLSKVIHGFHTHLSKEQIS